MDSFENKKSILVLLYPGCIFFELALATELLAKKYDLVYATPDGLDHHANNGMVIKSEASYKNADLSTCVAVLVPGGNFESVSDNSDSDQLLRAAFDKKIWIAAICAGPFLLAKAGLLKGKTIAHGFGPTQIEFLSSYFEGVTFSGEKFHYDGQILTARPEAHIDFAVELAARLEAINAKRANTIKDYYRGVLGKKIRPLSLGLISNKKNQYLYHQGYDSVKNEYFYRPLGGGIEFSELGAYTLKREIQEELGLDVEVYELLASYENIFTFEGGEGHEVIMLFKAEFSNPQAYEKESFDIYESGQVVAKAVWRSLAEIKAEKSKLYPDGLEKLILK